MINSVLSMKKKKSSKNKEAEALKNARESCPTLNQAGITFDGKNETKASAKFNLKA